jgi:hypothetical protein
MNIVAAECAVKKHHPEWSNVSGFPKLLTFIVDEGLCC